MVIKLIGILLWLVGGTININNNITSINYDGSGDPGAILSLNNNNNNSIKRIIYGGSGDPGTILLLTNNNNNIRTVWKYGWWSWSRYYFIIK